MRRPLLGLLLCSLAAACGPAPTAQAPTTSPEPIAVDAPEEPEASPPPTAEAPVAPVSADTQPAADEAGEIHEVSAAATATQPVKEPEPPSDVPGANMHVNRVTTDGVTIENVDCRSEGGGLGGLLGTLVIGKPFADRKSQLDRCVQGPHQTRVRWTAAGGKMTGVKVISGDSPANACIERALNGAMATVAGVCAASVEIGK